MTFEKWWADFARNVLTDHNNISELKWIAEAAWKASKKEEGEQK